MEIQWAVPGQSFVWPDRVVAARVVLGVLDQVQDIGDLVSLESLVFQGLEAAFPWVVLVR